MIFRKLGNPDPEAFFAELVNSHPGKYKPVDRYRDFRRVFLDTEEGKRVLHEIFSFCGMFRPIRNLETNAVIFHEGERNVGLKIMTTMNAEPKERPTRTKEK
jgi:hypothetical protein